MIKFKLRTCFQIKSVFYPDEEAYARTGGQSSQGRVPLEGRQSAPSSAIGFGGSGLGASEQGIFAGGFVRILQVRIKNTIE